jgi:hypothetical protein
MTGTAVAFDQVMRSMLLMLCIAGCVVGDGEPGDDDVTTIEAGSQLMKRVVIGRLYQKKDWTLPNVGPTPPERITYVCNVLAKVNPTYVSGLIRLDDDAPLTAEQIAVFNGIRDCLPNAKFDVVLNAEHYTDPKRHANGQQARDALKARAQEIKSQLHADIIFFDFFNSPYNANHDSWYRDALTDGTRFIRNTLNMKVGGNVWGLDLPPNSDFVALDNFDRQNTDGYAFDKQQVDKFKKRVPVMIHVENNPQKDGSKGLQWMNSSADYRRDQLSKYGGDQAQEGYSYMFPVFFPLECCAGGSCGPDKCDDQPSDRVAYDASQDANMLQKIDDGLGK